MAGNNIYVQGSYIDIHDNKVVNLSVDKGEVHVDQTNDSILGTGDDDTVATDVRMALAVQGLWEEGVLRHLYDYTWVMEVMNQTDGMPYFNTPASFITYLKAADVERLPSEDSINKKQNTFTGRFPDWIFVDCDATEAKRRINVGKRFLNIFKLA
jgi:hypothetical protein